MKICGLSVVWLLTSRMSTPAATWATSFVIGTAGVFARSGMEDERK